MNCYLTLLASYMRLPRGATRTILLLVFMLLSALLACVALFLAAIPYVLFVAFFFALRFCSILFASRWLSARIVQIPSSGTVNPQSTSRLCRLITFKESLTPPLGMCRLKGLNSFRCWACVAIFRWIVFAFASFALSLLRFTLVIASLC